MKKQKLTKKTPKLKLQRETLQNLSKPELALAVAGVTSFCRSGKTCCNATCNGTC
jgi:hypothetical protein